MYVWRPTAHSQVWSHYSFAAFSVVDDGVVLGGFWNISHMITPISMLWSMLWSPFPIISHHRWSLAGPCYEPLPLCGSFCTETWAWVQNTSCPRIFDISGSCETTPVSSFTSVKSLWADSIHFPLIRLDFCLAFKGCCQLECFKAAKFEEDFFVVVKLNFLPIKSHKV